MLIKIMEARDSGRDTIVRLDATYFSIQLKPNKTMGSLIIKTGDTPYYSYTCFTNEQYEEFSKTLEEGKVLDLSEYLFKMDDAHLLSTQKGLKEHTTNEIAKAVNYILNTLRG